MANRAYLLTVDDPQVTLSKHPKREILAEGINEIPVFWASLFVPGDRLLDTYETKRGELKVANWCVEARIAKQRLKSLHSPIGALLDRHSKQVWDQWVDVLSAQESKYFKTSAAEVWGLDPDGYEQHWAVLFKAFTKPTAATFKAALKSIGLEYRNRTVAWKDPEETVCKLAGAEHIRNLPWLDSKQLQTQTVVSEQAAELLVLCVCQALAERKAEKAEFSPEELLRSMVRALESRGIKPGEFPREMRARKISGPGVLIQGIEAMGKIGFKVELTTNEPSAFLTAPTWQVLFADSSTEPDPGDEQETAPAALGLSLWDQYQLFEKTSNRPYAAAELVLAVVIDLDSRRAELGPIRPEELLQGLVRRFEEYGVEPPDFRDELAKRKIGNPSELMQVIKDMQTVGFQVRLTTDDPAAFAAVPECKILFDPLLQT